MKIVQFRMSNASTTPAGSVSRPASKAAHDLQVRLLRRLVSHERFVSIASESYRSRCVARYGAILQGSGPFLDEAGDRHMPLRVSPINRPRDYGEIDLDLVLADESNRRIGLLGRPGAGKTWLMLRTALRVAASKAHRPTLPIVLRLKGFQNLSKKVSPRAMGEHLLGLLVRDLSVPPYAWTKDDFQQAAAKGWCLFLLDGIDELGSDDVRLIAPAIADLSRTLSACRFVVSSRTSSWPVGDDFAEFTKFEVQPIDPLGEDADIFLRGLDSLGDHATEFRRVVEGDRQLATALSTPLRLAIAAFIFRDRDGSIPADRMKMYQAASESFRDPKQAGAPNERVGQWMKVSPEMCLRFLTVYAAQMEASAAKRWTSPPPSPNAPAPTAADPGRRRSTPPLR